MIDSLKLQQIYIEGALTSGYSPPQSTSCDSLIRAYLVCNDIVLTLINDEAETADLQLLAQIGAMLARLIEPLGRHHNLEDRLHHRHFQFPVRLCRRRERWGRIHLNQPRLQVVLDQNVVPVQLEAVLVIDNHRLHTFQREVDDAADVVKALVRRFLAASLLQEEF